MVGGQTKPVLVLRLITADSIESHIYDRACKSLPEPLTPNPKPRTLNRPLPLVHPHPSPLTSVCCVCSVSSVWV